MNILIVDTSYNKLVVALKSRDRVAFRIIDCGMKKNNSLVLPTIDDVLDELNVGITDVGCFACVVGPGSFTGVRIGVATMNAFNDVFKKKLVSINALEILAYNIKGGSIMTLAASRQFTRKMRFTGESVPRSSRAKSPPSAGCARNASLRLAVRSASGALPLDPAIF